MELYGRYGIKTITMDDISRTCGISKKTLYENYANKNEVVNGVMSKLIDNLEHKYLLSVAEASNAVAEVMLSLGGIQHFFRKVNYIMLEDLEKYYYEIWVSYQKFRDETGLGLLINNIERGIKEGVYHDMFNTQIIAKMRLQQLNDIHQNAYYNNNLKETLGQVSHHYIAGLATIKGWRLLEKYIKEQK